MDPALAPLLVPSCPLPSAEGRLEEIAPLTGPDFGAALGFALARLEEYKDSRPLVLAIPRAWLSERGRPFAQGIAQGAGITASRLLLIAPPKPAQALWALEEALKSGAVAGGLGLAAEVGFVITRRLDFAARAGRAAAILLRPKPADDLSAAHLRWRIGSLASAMDDLDARSPGRARWRADLVRRRDGPPKTWDVEQDDETHRLRLAAGLAGDGLVADARTLTAA
jgi:protein ImuA